MKTVLYGAWRGFGAWEQRDLARPGMKAPAGAREVLVWMAPALQGFWLVRRFGRVQSCVRPVDAVL